MKNIKGRQKGRKDTATISVVLERTEYELLAKMSEQQGVSMSSIVRNWIRSKLK